jgi:hypothetical protein
MADRLLLRARPTATLIVSSDADDPAQGVAAFVAALGLGPWIDAVSSGVKE